ncbi:cation-translocating P-type ATPase [Pseudaestuariivita rosea]|uniref:cation-translocating P-type ATPase n=1 Tax=Pseudaestuariivita rosea TaxID=2763263 RepID=UPI001F4904E0|nr:cation-transporting P-type ATPase [Pseudaestuariivita rosea]
MPDRRSSLGLSQPQVLQLRQTAGWNELPQGKRASMIGVLLRQFSSFLVLILIAAALIAVIVGESIDALAIGLVILLNAGLGFVQEWRAETALQALRDMMTPKAVVLRDGVEQVIAARDLVPDDVIILTAGDKVPADARLVHSVDLRLDESVLTGESLPVEKAAAQGQDQVFAGTSVISGRAEAQVTATGAKTEFGQIAVLTGAVGPKKTNLQVKLGRLATQLGAAALLVAASVVGLGIWFGRDQFEMMMTGLSMSVAMVPEGLPAVVTITLALGAAAMIRQKALARRLQAVETLGAASVICTDKTGTLTENKMTATSIWTATRSYDVTGTGYDPTGHIETDGRRVRAEDDIALSALLTAGLFCNHAALQRDGATWRVTGVPTEAALVTLAYKGWCPLPDPNAMIAEAPFSSDRKCMSVLFRDGAGGHIYTKGAPERLLDLCNRIRRDDQIVPLTETDRTEIIAAYDSMASQGLRVIALAEKTVPDHVLTEDDMVFLGLVGLIDPPRAEVKAAVRAARSAGIKIVMITGDSPVTARAIAEQLQLPVHQTVIGDDLTAMDDADLISALNDDVVFARTKPEHKMRIVAALQSQDQIVAMTGDGVNDAPALKKADIGVSMGIRGTDVARDASDLILLDDNFATIVRAIGEGRRQFANVRKFVRYLLSSNAGEVVALVVNILVGGPLIFLATQILWMNLVTDGVTAVALGLEKSEPDQLKQPPRPKNQPILGISGIVSICVLGLYTGGASLWIFFSLIDVSVDLARTTAFTAMVVFEKVSVFAFRSLSLPCWRIGLLSNPLLLIALAVTLGAQVVAVYWAPLQTLLHTVPIGTDEWLLIAAFALPIIVIPEVLKTVTSRTRRSA